jgi:hypothetical protein
MAGKRAGVETGAARIRLDDIRDRSASQPRGRDCPGFVDRTEQRPGLDTSRVQPIPQRLDRAIAKWSLAVNVELEAKATARRVKRLGS